MRAPAVERLGSHARASTSQPAFPGAGAANPHLHGARGTQARHSRPRRQFEGGSSLVARASGSDEPEFAVFRFTLGIPGFDDALLPRVVGGLGLALLALNHVLNDAPWNAGQVRAEAIGALLAGLCTLVPALEQRIQSVAPGRGRQAGSAALDGSEQLFALAEGLSDAHKQELAWASYVLLKNTNTAGLLVARGGEVLLARGAQSAALLQGGKDLAPLSQAVQAGGLAAGPQTQQYFPERTGMGGQAARLLPAGAQCLLLQPATDGALTVAVWSGAPRAFAPRDRRWVGCVADKLAGCLRP